MFPCSCLSTPCWCRRTSACGACRQTGTSAEATFCSSQTPSSHTRLPSLVRLHVLLCPRSCACILLSMGNVTFTAVPQMTNSFAWLTKALLQCLQPSMMDHSQRRYLRWRSLSRHARATSAHQPQSAKQALAEPARNAASPTRHSGVKAPMVGHSFCPQLYSPYLLWCHACLCHEAVDDDCAMMQCC